MNATILVWSCLQTMILISSLEFVAIIWSFSNFSDPIRFSGLILGDCCALETRFELELWTDPTFLDLVLNFSCIFCTAIIRFLTGIFNKFNTNSLQITITNIDWGVSARQARKEKKEPRKRWPWISTLCKLTRKRRPRLHAWRETSNSPWAQGYDPTHHSRLKLSHGRPMVQ